MSEPLKSKAKSDTSARSTLGVIYIIHMSGTDFYKIGWVKRRSNLKTRLAKFQTGNPHKLRFVATMPGHLKDEKSHHVAMQHWKIGFSEWFVYNPKLSALIEANANVAALAEQ